MREVLEIKFFKSGLIGFADVKGVPVPDEKVTEKILEECRQYRDVTGQDEARLYSLSPREVAILLASSQTPKGCHYKPGQ